MMSSPDYFILRHKNDSYEQLLSLRDQLFRKIRAFENQQIPEDQWRIHPSPEVVYQMNLKYLGVLCDYISDRYNTEYVWKKYRHET